MDPGKYKGGGAKAINIHTSLFLDSRLWGGAEVPKPLPLVYLCNKIDKLISLIVQRLSSFETVIPLRSTRKGAEMKFI